MKYLIIPFLFIGVASADSDCIPRLANLSIGIKLRAMIKEKIFGENSKYKARPIDQTAVCNEIVSEGLLEDQENKRKIVKNLQNELDKNKKVKSTFLNGITDEEPSQFTTGPEICALLDKQIQKYTESEDLPTIRGAGLAHENYVKNPLLDSCKRLVDVVRIDEENRLVRVKQDFKREPPGEEIAPAEDPVTPKKSLFSETGVPQKTENVERAKVKFTTSPGAGASSQ